MDNTDQTLNNHSQENVTAPNTAPVVNPELNQPVTANTATNQPKKPKIWVFVLLGMVILGVVSLIILELVLPPEDDFSWKFPLPNESMIGTPPPISRSDTPLSPTEIFDELERLLSEEYELISLSPPVDNIVINSDLELFIWTSDDGYNLNLDDNFNKQLLWVPDFECGNVGVAVQTGYRQLVVGLNRNITRLMIDADTGYISNAQNSRSPIGNDGIVSWAFENEDYLIMFSIAPRCVWHDGSLYIPIVLNSAPRTSLELAYQEQVPILHGFVDSSSTITHFRHSDIDSNFASIGLSVGVGSIIEVQHGGLFVFENGVWMAIPMHRQTNCRDWDTLPDLMQVPMDLRWRCFDEDMGEWRCNRELYDRELYESGIGIFLCDVVWE